MKIKFTFLLTLIAGFSVSSFAQITANLTSQQNTICNGADCDYSGPSILINEIMASPTTNDGCLSGSAATACGGEWIELYNPDICHPIDISCYYLGATTPGVLGSDQEGFLLPAGTIVPPGGFCLVRGFNATPVDPTRLVQNGGNVVEIVMPSTINGDGMCVTSSLGSPTRFWFPNAAGGWFAFYDRNGVPQDCVYWGATGSITGGQPCVPTSTNCNNSVSSLAGFTSIPANRKSQISTVKINDSWGHSFRRVPDGGAWEAVPNQDTYVETPTPANCNSTCATLGSSTCNGSATINVTGGGTPPYTYLWDDSRGQMTPTADSLCAGTYNVVVTDANNVSQTFSVTVDQYSPNVTLNLNMDVCNQGQTVAIGGNPQPATSAEGTGVFSGTGISGTSFNVTTPGDFTVTYTYTDTNNCVDSAQGQIHVHPMPTPTISGIDAQYCQSDSSITIVVSPTGGTITIDGNPSNGTFTTSGLGAGSHTIKYVVSTQYGCTDSTMTTFNVSAVTPPTFTIPSQICPNAAAVPLSGSPSGGTFTLNGQPITSFDPSIYSVGTYTITYTVQDATNPQCDATSSQQIAISNTVNFTENIQDYFCYGASDYTLSIQPAGGTWTGTLINATGDGLSISTAEPNQQYSIHYDYTSPDGCSGTFDKNITVGPQLKVGMTVEQGCFQDLTFTAKPQSGNLSNYQWNDGGTAMGNGSPLKKTIDPFGDHIFTLTATDNHGCTVSTDSAIYVNEGYSAKDIKIPNVITPNGDGINDVIEMPLITDSCMDYKVLILNRWGDLVYECDRNKPIFAGKDKGGKALNAGVYFYKLESNSFDCKSDKYKGACQGFITIITKK